MFDIGSAIGLASGAASIAKGISGGAGGQQFSSKLLIPPRTPEEKFAIQAAINMLMRLLDEAQTTQGQEGLRSQLQGQTSAQFSGRPTLNRDGLLAQIKLRMGQGLGLSMGPGSGAPFEMGSPVIQAAQNKFSGSEFKGAL